MARGTSGKQLERGGPDVRRWPSASRARRLVEWGLRLRHSAALSSLAVTAKTLLSFYQIVSQASRVLESTSLL